MSKRGFSLVEITLALGITSFCILVVFALAAQGYKTARESRLEAAAAILFGQIHSELRSPFAWSTPGSSTGRSRLGHWLGEETTLTDVAAGSATITTSSFFNEKLEPTLNDEEDQDEFEVRVRVFPVGPSSLDGPDEAVQEAIASLAAAESTVAVAVSISYPARAPFESRSQRRFVFLSTRPAP